MTTAIARQFVELLESDNSLQTQLVVYGPEDFDDLVEFAESKGYWFTKDELLEILDDYPEGALSLQMRAWAR